MGRIVIAITALLVATAADAATSVSLDLDASSYSVGEDITITATLVTDGTQALGPLEGFILGVGWDPSVASVANAGVIYPEGNGTQLVTDGPGAGGSVLTYNGGTPISSPVPTPRCDALGPSCDILIQVQSNPFTPVTLDAQTLVATLVLEAVGVGPLGQSIENVVFPGNPIIPGIELGPNWLAGPVVVPEPATGLLLALGLLGIAGARRRRC